MILRRIPKIPRRWLHTPIETVTKKEPHSPLSQHLADIMKVNGPLSVASFMRQALTNPLGGYYMHRDVFGKQGDFITSPEISQLFGEMVGVWSILQMQSLLHDAQDVALMELGPGRGTLMADVLRTIENFPEMKQKIKKIHLVEASPHLKQTQHKTLGCTAQDISKWNIPVHWHQDLSQVPEDMPCILLAHEFFDALPVYQFRLNESKLWREVLVDIDESTTSPHHFRFVLAPSQTNAVAALMNGGPTSERFHPDKFQTHDQIEVSPDAWTHAHLIAQRITATKGIALIIDYGNDHASSFSLRGIRKHAFTSPLSHIGDTDLTVDVDFSLLKDACHRTAHAHGPMLQSHFLQSLGITHRKEELFKACHDHHLQQQILSGYDRLLDLGKGGMGHLYKVLAITPANIKHVPYPFTMNNSE